MKGIISTARLSIAPLVIEDAAFMLALMQTPGWIKYIGDRGLASLAEAQTYLQHYFLDHPPSAGIAYYVVRDADQQPIGMLGFLKKANLQYHDFGFAFMPHSQGQGLAYEACDALLKYTLKENLYPVLDAITLPTNLASQNLLSKLSFIKRGELVLPSSDVVLLYRWYA